jgi:hypothetical protein
MERKMILSDTEHIQMDVEGEREISSRYLSPYHNRTSGKSRSISRA